MKKANIAFFVSSLIVAGLVCGACNKDADLTPGGTVQKPTDASQLANQGTNGAKAKNGGGMMPSIRPAAPGEKTGIPK